MHTVKKFIILSVKKNSHSVHVKQLLLTLTCLSAFRFPMKLAVSAFVAFVAIYHVRLQSVIRISCLDQCPSEAKLLHCSLFCSFFRRRCCWSSWLSPRSTSFVPVSMKTSPSCYLGSALSCQTTGWRLWELWPSTPGCWRVRVMIFCGTKKCNGKHSRKICVKMYSFIL